MKRNKGYAQLSYRVRVKRGQRKSEPSNVMGYVCLIRKDNQFKKK